MHPITLRLAALRLAPVQCVSWGHPDTSGLPTIDYFLSGDLMEPPDADDHYTEKLIRLPNLSIYYTPLHIKNSEINRDTFGLSSQSVMYHCCQFPFKFLPQYDEVFPRIAQEVDQCQFLFGSHPSSHIINNQFRTRIKKAFDRFSMDADKYAVFLPYLDGDHYYALYRLSDIMLDPIGWSGFNTTFEAISCDLPVITLPSKLMRGRGSAAILKMIGLTDTIATTIDEYIRIAIKLGKDVGRRKHLSSRIAETKHYAYRDKTSIVALEDFFQNIVEKLNYKN